MQTTLYSREYESNQFCIQLSIVVSIREAINTLYAINYAQLSIVVSIRASNSAYNSL